MIKITKEAMLDLYQDNPIYTSNFLTNYFECTYPCLWKVLNKFGYYTSYTHNSRYFTLANIPDFDENNIWFYSDSEVGPIGFTLHKTASNLITALINSCESGLSERELGKILKIRLSNQLVSLVKKSKIRKNKLDGKFLYFSVDKTIYKKQFNKANKTGESSSRPESYYKHRIARLTAARDSWRQRSNEKQQTIREQLIRIRDLERGRDTWKEKSITNNTVVQQFKSEIKHLKKKLSGQPIKKTNS